MVGAGVGDGLTNTKELHVWTFDHANQAMASTIQEEWLQAVKEEYENIEENENTMDHGVLEVTQACDVPKGAKVLSINWVLGLLAWVNCVLAFLIVGTKSTVNRVKASMPKHSTTEEQGEMQDDVGCKIKQDQTERWMKSAVKSNRNVSAARSTGTKRNRVRSCRRMMELHQARTWCKLIEMVSCIESESCRVSCLPKWMPT
jgi:hypothetical protein